MISKRIFADGISEVASVVILGKIPALFFRFSNQVLGKFLRKVLEMIRVGLAFNFFWVRVGSVFEQIK